MSLDNITLTAAMRQNVLSLQNTQTQMNSTETTLATGKRVNTALDNPIAYFAAQSYTNRANDLSNLKDNMNEAIQTVTAGNNGITGIENLVQQAQSIANSALATTSQTTINSLATQYGDVLGQITQMAVDSNYGGTNLLQDATLKVTFDNSNTNSFLNITGFSADATGLGLNGGAATGAWATTQDINTDVGLLNTATTSLRTQASNMSNNLAVVNSRLDFTNNMINTLQTGSDDLTLADMNQEGADLLTLQTQQQLGITALSLASQAAQSVLKLF
ncbi:MAG: flagellin [Thermodesulfobacteriota bacterium]